MLFDISYDEIMHQIAAVARINTVYIGHRAPTCHNFNIIYNYDSFLALFKVVDSTFSQQIKTSFKQVQILLVLY
jgi:TRAP-type C4-dicarboxylate transport system substrate-binding protein